jgi:hypothetical protein
MDNSKMDATRFTTSKQQADSTPRVDALNGLNRFIEHTNNLVVVTIPEIGTFKVKAVQVSADPQWILVNIIDLTKHEYTYMLPRSTQFTLYIGY